MIEFHSMTCELIRMKIRITPTTSLLCHSIDSANTERARDVAELLSTQKNKIRRIDNIVAPRSRSQRSESKQIVLMFIFIFHAFFVVVARAIDVQRGDHLVR